MDILSFPKLTPKQKQLEKVLEFDYISRVRGFCPRAPCSRPGLVNTAKQSSPSNCGLCIFLSLHTFQLGFVCKHHADSEVG